MKKYIHKLSGLEVESTNGTCYFKASEEQVLKLGFVEEYNVPPGIIEVKTYGGHILKVSDEIGDGYPEYINYHLKSDPKSVVHAIKTAGGLIFRVGEWVREPALRNPAFQITALKFDEFYKSWYAYNCSFGTIVGSLLPCGAPSIKYFREINTGQVVRAEGRTEYVSGIYEEVEVTKKTTTTVSGCMASTRYPDSKYFR